MDKNAFIDGYMKVEESAASIYKDLMQIFPEHNDFWKNLYDDETDHLSFLNDVKSLGLINELQKIDLPPSMPIINETLKQAGVITEKITSGSLALDDALTMTLKLEESMVETYTNKVIAHLMSCENETCFEKIIADEKTHINKIKNKISGSQ